MKKSKTEINLNTDLPKVRRTWKFDASTRITQTKKGKGSYNRKKYKLERYE